MRALALALALACVNVFLWFVRNLARPLRARWRAKERLRALVVLGSGGHTSEMLSLLERLPADSYAPRTYVVARTDDKSASKALERERRLTGASASVVRIGRAREVGQSFLTSAATTAFALVEAVAVSELRLQVLANLASAATMPAIGRELDAYLRSPQEELVRLAVRAAARCVSETRPGRTDRSIRAAGRWRSPCQCRASSTHARS